MQELFLFLKPQKMFPSALGNSNTLKVCADVTRCKFLESAVTVNALNHVSNSLLMLFIVAKVE